MLGGGESTQVLLERDAVPAGHPPDNPTTTDRGGRSKLAAAEFMAPLGFEDDKVVLVRVGHEVPPALIGGCRCARRPGRTRPRPARVRHLPTRSTRSTGGGPTPYQGVLPPRETPRARKMPRVLCEHAGSPPRRGISTSSPTPTQTRSVALPTWRNRSTGGTAADDVGAGRQAAARCRNITGSRAHEGQPQRRLRTLADDLAAKPVAETEIAST